MQRWWMTILQLFSAGLVVIIAIILLLLCYKSSFGRGLPIPSEDIS